MVPKTASCTILLENGLTATLRSSGDPSLNAVREKLFHNGETTPPEYCYIASVKFEDEFIHLLLWTCGSQQRLNQIIRELETNLNGLPSNFMIGLGHEVNRQVRLYFWNKQSNPRSKGTKTAKMLWKALTGKMKPSIQMLLSR
jgi:hypothetical protein